MMNKSILNLICFILFFKCNFIIAQQKLGEYKIVKNGVTISGLSSGAAMAVQMHVAFSKDFSGVGIVTGPPYYCAGTGGSNNALTTCMYLSGSTINIDSAVSSLNGYISNDQADDTTNLKNDKVYIYHGTVDYTVTEGVVKKNEDFYKKYLASTSNIKTLYTIASSNGFITNNFGALCNVLSSPNYMNNCAYNQAYDILKHMYGLVTAQPDKTASYQESLIEFDQTEFFPSGTSATISMDSTGYVYIPRACTQGRACKLHVVLHGCVQSKSSIKDVFVSNAGYNQVADANDIIILYPQAKATTGSNPNGCWDWWGYTTANYANKDGPQMKAIKAMIDRLTNGGSVDENNTTNAASTTTAANGGSTTIASSTTKNPVTCFKGK